MWRHWPAGRRWRRRCWPRSTWWEPSWWLWGCGIYSRLGFQRSGSVRSAGKAGWRRTTRSRTTETTNSYCTQKTKAMGFESVQPTEEPKDRFKFLTWMTPITITQPQKSKIPRMLSGKVTIKENFTEKTNQTTYWCVYSCKQRDSEPYSQCTAERLSASYRPEIKEEVHIKKKNIRNNLFDLLNWDSLTFLLYIKCQSNPCICKIN